MIGKYYRPNKVFVDGFVEKMDSLSQIDSVVITDHIPEVWQKLELAYGNARSQPLWDIQNVTSNQLIENIDQAFHIWKKVPWAENYNFSEFCEYVLPYRGQFEAPSQWRQTIFEEYKWVLDSADQGVVAIGNMLTDSLMWFNYYGDMLGNLPEMKIEELKKSKYGTCRQLSTLKVAVLRSLGIPAAHVFDIPPVTTWVSLLDENGIFVDYGDFYKLEVGKYYLEEADRRFTKVYMSTFEIQPNYFEGEDIDNIPPFFRNRYIKDVSISHGKTTNVEVDIKHTSPNKSSKVYLYVFQRGKFIAVDWSEISNQKALFEQIAPNRIYFPFYYSYGNLTPAADAFYINKSGQLVSMVKKLEKGTEQAKIVRKYPLTPQEIVYAKLMVGATIEGANNPEFENPTLLYEIHEEPTMMEQKSVLENHKKFRYVRYKSNKLIGVAELAFLGDGNKILKGKPVIGPKMKMADAINAFDGDITTNCNSTNVIAIDSKKEIVNQVGEVSWFGLDFGKPKEISKVRYIFRSSFNTIEPGHEYELRYWENEWKSLGRKKADDVYIFFDNVPKQTILWLRNHTSGSYEEVFFMKGGQQIFG